MAAAGEQKQDLLHSLAPVPPAHLEICFPLLLLLPLLLLPGLLAPLPAAAPVPPPGPPPAQTWLTEYTVTASPLLAPGYQSSNLLYNPAYDQADTRLVARPDPAPAFTTPGNPGPPPSQGDDTRPGLLELPARHVDNSGPSSRLWRLIRGKKVKLTNKNLAERN